MALCLPTYRDPTPRRHRGHAPRSRLLLSAASRLKNREQQRGEAVSTPPLTLVVGEIRMPRLRPLELVSRSLGREWSLLPPNVSFRTELKALYAAMLRTFCLSADAIRTMCRWDPQSLRQQSAMTATPDAATPARFHWTCVIRRTRRFVRAGNGTCLRAVHVRSAAWPRLRG